MTRIEAGARHHQVGPVLLIGASGMLGRAFCRALENAFIPYTPATRREINLTDERSIERWAEGPRGREGQCRTWINCAAWTDVDGAETHEAAAVAANGTGVGALAKWCRQAGATLVNFSTDYVFDGRATRPYRVDEPRNPIGAYGRSKAVGEELLEASGCPYLNIRTSWLYAPWGKNFVRTIAALAKSRPSLKVVDDQRGRPTSAEHLAAATLELVAHGARGTYHATDGGECSWFGFAEEIVRLTDAACRVEPCTTAEFPRPAKRPAYSVLDLSKTEEVIGNMPDWRENLAGVVMRIEA